MIFFKILWGVIRTCRNWPALLLSRLLGKLGWPDALAVSEIRLRNGLRFTTGSRRRLGASDLFLVWEMWYCHAYLIPGDPEFQIHDSDVIVDIGGNKGYFSIYAAHQAPHGRVFAFEPEPDNAALFKQNVELNRINNVNLERSAVAERAGTMDLHLSEINEGGHSLYATGGKTVSVPTVTLDEYCRTLSIHEIDFLKIDCEGAEYAILPSLPAELLQKIKLISMEHHPVPGHRAQELVDFLKTHGFAIRQFDSLYIKAVNQNWHGPQQ